MPAQFTDEFDRTSAIERVYLGMGLRKFVKVPKVKRSLKLLYWSAEQ